MYKKLSFWGLVKILGFKSAVRYMLGTAKDGIDFYTVGDSDD